MLWAYSKTFAPTRIKWLKTKAALLSQEKPHLTSRRSRFSVSLTFFCVCVCVSLSGHCLTDNSFPDGIGGSSRHWPCHSHCVTQRWVCWYVCAFGVCWSMSPQWVTSISLLKCCYLAVSLHERKMTVSESVPSSYTVPVSCSNHTGFCGYTS